MNTPKNPEMMTEDDPTTKGKWFTNLMKKHPLFASSPRLPRQPDDQSPCLKLKSTSGSGHWRSSSIKEVKMILNNNSKITSHKKSGQSLTFNAALKATLATLFWNLDLFTTLMPLLTWMENSLKSTSLSKNKRWSLKPNQLQLSGDSLTNSIVTKRNQKMSNEKSPAADLTVTKSKNPKTKKNKANPGAIADLRKAQPPPADPAAHENPTTTNENTTVKKTAKTTGETTIKMITRMTKGKIVDIKKETITKRREKIHTSKIVKMILKMIGRVSIRMTEKAIIGMKEKWTTKKTENTTTKTTVEATTADKTPSAKPFVSLANKTAAIPTTSPASNTNPALNSESRICRVSPTKRISTTMPNMQKPNSLSKKRWRCTFLVCITQSTPKTWTTCSGTIKTVRSFIRNWSGVK